MKTCTCGKQCASNARTCPQCGHRFTGFLTKALAWIIGLLIAIGFIFAVTARGEETEFATLIIYRTRQFHAGGRKANIEVDGDKVRNLSNGRYVILELASGQHRIAVSKSGGVEDTFKAGQVYYLRVKPEDDFTAQVVPASQARVELEALKPQDGNLKSLP